MNKSCKRCLPDSWWVCTEEQKEAVTGCPYKSKIYQEKEMSEQNFDIKHDEGKSIAGCLEEFSLALEAMAEVFTAGKKEGYARGSWEKVDPLRYKDAEWRHRLAGKREALDPKSGLPHKYHEIWNMLAQLELDERAALNEQPQIHTCNLPFIGGLSTEDIHGIIEKIDKVFEAVKKP